MNAIQWLLDGLGRRLIAWSAALNRGDRRGTPGPPVAPNEPFDAKRHWLDRVAHLPPQAWQQGGRAAPPRRTPGRAAVPERDLPPTVPTVRRSPEAASVLPPVASHGHGPVYEALRPPLLRGEPAAATVADSAEVVRAAPEAARTPGVARAAPAARVAPPIYVETVTRRPVQVPLVTGRAAQRVDPARTASPSEPESSALLHRATTPASSAAPAPAIVSDHRDDPRAAVTDHHEPAPREARSRDRDRDTARRPPPIAGFDMKRTRAPELPQPAMAQAAPLSRAVPMPRAAAPIDGQRGERAGRTEHDTDVDLNPPARGWPELPPWPAPRDPQSRGADPHARARRQRLELEQRG